MSTLGTVEPPSPSDEIVLSDFLRPLVGRGRHIRKGTLFAVLVAAILGGVYFIVQPSTESTVMGIRPTFEGAAAGRYPNGLPFATTDIVNTTILDEVYERNTLQEYCPAELFRSAFVVQETSPLHRFLALEYEGALADTRLTTVDRRRLQDEYAAKADALQARYELTFLQPARCSIPPTTMNKVMTEIPQTWARHSDERRGVMKFRVPVLSPRLFDELETMQGEDALVRADMLRTAIMRVIENITSVERLPGSELVRGSDADVSFAETRLALEDLRSSRLDALIGNIAGASGASTRRFLEQALQASEIRLASAQQRADAYKDALRQYAGVPSAVTPGEMRPVGPQSPSDVQSLTPQIDQTFIDKIVELSEANSRFRQEITREGIAATIQAVERAAIVEQYRQLLAAITARGGAELPLSAVNAALDRLTADAKEATRRFNEIYEEYVRVSLRPGPAMYRVETPVDTTTVRAFNARDLVVVLIVVVIVAPLLLILVFLSQYYVRRFAETMR